jgi:predicted nucleotidyltransferase
MNAVLSGKPTGLSPDMIAKIRTYFAGEARVTRIVLFGSRAKGTWRIGSDIDLCAYGSDIQISDAARWKDDLEESLFPWSVDMVAFSLINNPALREHIERVGVSLL